MFSLEYSTRWRRGCVPDSCKDVKLVEVLHRPRAHDGKGDGEEAPEECEGLREEEEGDHRDEGTAVRDGAEEVVGDYGVKKVGIAGNEPQGE